jgi:G3E family GTPase
MSLKKLEQKIQSVPTNIITGFLGVGKTTFILKLLQQKPSQERWAVLVNEFGEVGIDGSLIRGLHPEREGIFVREVPGGCMCCASGLPMHIALYQLLTKAKPDRLLIEPTGLGHPQEVLDVLSAESYAEVLDIQHCLTLVDARKLSDSRYTQNSTFNQQIDIADIVIGHKSDLYESEHQDALNNYVLSRKGEDTPVYFAENGNLDPFVLMGKSAASSSKHGHVHSHGHTTPNSLSEEALPESGLLKIKNSGEGFESVGWRFSSEHVFDRACLFHWLTGLSVERAKGVFITRDGIFAYNLSADTLTESELDEVSESRVEIISTNTTDIDEQNLIDCIELS